MLGIKSVGENQFGDVCTLPGNRIGQLEAIIGIKNGKINLEAGEVPFLEMYPLIEAGDNSELRRLGYFMRKANAREGNTDDRLVELWRVDKKLKIQIVRGPITHDGKIRLIQVTEGKGAEVSLYFVLPSVEISGSDESGDIGKMLSFASLTDVSNWSFLHEFKIQLFTPVKFHLYRKIYYYPDKITCLWMLLIPTPSSRQETPAPKGRVIHVNPGQLKFLREIELIDAKTLEMALVSIATESSSDEFRRDAALLLDEISPDWLNNFPITEQMQ